MNVSSIRKLLVALTASALLPLAAEATPLTLNYSITGNTYDFTLILDNHDSSWAAGQSFNWITFGDSRTQSPLADFVGDTSFLPIGPFIEYNFSYGGHNGPTLVDVYSANLVGWVPTAVGSSLHWQGTSQTHLEQGKLLWSNLIGGNGAVNADMEVAMLQPVPEPETYGMLVTGLLLLGAASRYKRNSKT